MTAAEIILDALAQRQGYATIRHRGAQAAVGRLVGVGRDRVHAALRGDAGIGVLVAWAVGAGLTVTIGPDGCRCEVAHG